ncbi:ParA family protein [Noviherbaspirillum pedocola]|uniref:ParA family protein n=1 Tax=Noviherbaspirillum pedocola TaxID=2801341 RepID=A0A934T4A4_9BURK|nr:ParA family protein [Noviherbaspirillum pedocola]MBK4739223.1 ParA family protein [Noviherbaspirillum pedocola]
MFASPKGGVGKTTSCLLLAQMLARTGAKVAIIDADGRHRCSRWIKDESGARHAGIPENIQVEDAGSEDIQDKIEAAAATADYVLVDLQGAADLTMYEAIQLSDFVVIPTKPSDMDVEEATATIRLIYKHQKTIQKAGNPDYRLPFGVLFTMTNAALRSRTMKHIEANLIAARIPIFETEINERDAYRAFYSFRTTLDQLTEKEAPNVSKAIENADRFAREVLDAAAGKKDLTPPAAANTGAQA